MYVEKNWKIKEVCDWERRKKKLTLIGQRIGLFNVREDFLGFGSSGVKGGPGLGNKGRRGGGLHFRACAGLSVEPIGELRDENGGHFNARKGKLA